MKLMFEGHELSAQNGKSAYEIAVDDGYEGTQEEWLKSLQGQPGKSATINGVNTLDIVAGENVSISQDGGTMTISASVQAEIQEIYSTEEIRIGTWIDGKPLYRQTYVTDYTLPGYGTATYSTNIPVASDIDACVNLYGMATPNTRTPSPLNFYIYSDTRSITTYYDARSNAITVSIHEPASNAWKSLHIVATLEYTKASD